MIDETKKDDDDDDDEKTALEKQSPEMIKFKIKEIRF